LTSLHDILKNDAPLPTTPCTARGVIGTGTGLFAEGTQEQRTHHKNENRPGRQQTNKRAKTNASHHPMHACATIMSAGGCELGTQYWQKMRSKTTHLKRTSWSSLAVCSLPLGGASKLPFFRPASCCSPPRLPLIPPLLLAPVDVVTLQSINNRLPPRYARPSPFPAWFIFDLISYETPKTLVFGR